MDFPKAVVSYDTCKCIIVDKKHETYSQINSTSTVTPYPYNKRSYTFCWGYSQQLLYKIKTLVYYSAECVSVLSYWQCSWALGIVEKWHRAVFACIYIGGIFLTPLSVCIYESYFYFNTPVLCVFTIIRRKKIHMRLALKIFFFYNKIIPCNIIILYYSEWSCYKMIFLNLEACEKILFLYKIHFML